MESKDYKLNDIVEMRKPHPCSTKSKLFEIVILKPIYIVYIALLFVLDIGLFNFLYDFCEKKLFKYKNKLIN